MTLPKPLPDDNQTKAGPRTIDEPKRWVSPTLKVFPIPDVTRSGVVNGTPPEDLLYSNS